MVAFRRHLLTKHSLRLVTRRRYDRTVEEFVPIPADEVKRRRMLLSNRQGGRSELRRQLRQAMSMPPPSAKPKKSNQFESPKQEISDEPPEKFSVASEVHDLVSSSPSTTTSTVTEVIVSSDNCFYCQDNFGNAYVSIHSQALGNVQVPNRCRMKTIRQLAN